MANECIPFYQPGQAITAQTTGAVTGKRVLGISGARQSGPAVSDNVGGGNIQVAHAGAGTRAFGVADRDAASGAKVVCLRGSGLVVPITAGATVTAGQTLEVGTNGQVIPLASGIPVGIAVQGAASGSDAQVSLL